MVLIVEDENYTTGIVEGLKMDYILVIMVMYINNFNFWNQYKGEKKFDNQRLQIETTSI